MTTLPEFLLARIAEDEYSQRAQMVTRLGGVLDYRPGEWHRADCEYLNTEGVGDGRCDCDVPARVLADCEAKRRIVEEWKRDLDEGVEEPNQLFAVRCLALPYADHPDFREEWRP